MKTFYKTILLLFLNVPFLIFNSDGQGENNIWYFGYHCGLDFNSGSPVALTNGQANVYEGTATVSDAAGNLLFYSDGVTVWNSNHISMPNGTGLMGDGSSTQSATIVPMPGSSTQYYIFTCPPLGPLGNFRYSIVDMTLDGGDGDVTLKNVPLHVQSSEKCVAVHKNNSPGIWVIGHSVDTIFYSYLVTSSGINSPVLSFHQPNPGGYVTGYMKASPMGNKIAAALYTTSFSTNNFVLYDFNCNNGSITNEMIFPINDNLYGLEFSPDGSKLYVFPLSSSPTPIYQYDVTLSTAAAIAASQIIVGYSSHSYLGSAQIGPDQKIYIAIHSFGYLSVINNPNMQGAACNFVDNAVDLVGNNSALGLPALIRGSVCNVTGIGDVSGDLNEWQISPNPSNGIFKINFPKVLSQFIGTESYSMEVINTLGQKVFLRKESFGQSELLQRSPFGQTSNLKLQTNLDLSFLPKGIYVLKINDRELAFSFKLVIQ